MAAPGIAGRIAVGRIDGLPSILRTGGRAIAHDDHAFLADLAAELCDTAATDGANALVYVQPSAAGGLEAGTRSFGVRRPADALLGFVAPDDWTAIGWAGRGRPHPLDGDPRRKLPPSSAVVVLVHRNGDVVGRLRMGDTTSDEPPAYGLTLDGLQRAFGLPTAPPLVTTGVRFAAMWLEQIAWAGRERHGRAPGSAPGGGLTWAEAAVLHPATAILAGEPGAGDDLCAAAKALERVCDWERLRWLVVEGSWHEPAVTPTDAAWLDAGAFSRWVMTFTPPLHVLLAEVRRATGAGIARRCRAMLHQLGLQRGDPQAGGGRSAA